jgi:trimethylamine-N-oxide reductase (cytochrome c)
VAAVAKKVSELLNDGGEIYNAYTCNEKPVDRIIELFWQGSGVAHLDVNDDFHKKDIFVMPADPDIQDTPAGLHDFYHDPKSQPLSTPTGLLEFTSTAIEKHFPDDQERPPFPKWVEKSELHDERLSSERAKKYPLLCMSNHGRWRFHANLDDITWNREVETMKLRARDGYQYEPLWLHTSEAEKRGIRHGDIVKVYNERGTVLCGAYVTERLIPNTCYVDHGARLDPIIPGVLDRGGCINCITPTAMTSKNSTGMATTSFLAEVRKVTDEEMAAWRRDYPEAFARKIDEAAGVCLEGWLVNG